MKKTIILVSALTVILFTGCADVSPHAIECITSDSYGFWSGLWHGMVAPIAFIYSLFVDDVAIYAYDNSGSWYNFGFVLGIGALGSSTTVASKRRH